MKIVREAAGGLVVSVSGGGSGGQQWVNECWKTAGSASLELFPTVSECS